MNAPIPQHTFDEVEKQVISAANVLPSHMRSGAVMYVIEGILPGGFMTSILHNDFMRAAGQADSINQINLFYYAKFLSAIPIACWGSNAKVQAWLQGGGLRGRLENLSEVADPASDPL